MHGSRGRRRRLAKTRRAQHARPSIQYVGIDYGFVEASTVVSAWERVEDLSQLSLAELSQRLNALQSDKKRNGQRRQK